MFKPGDTIKNKITGRVDTVESVPGMSEYDEKDFIDASIGMVTKSHRWEVQNDWELVPSDEVPASPASLSSIVVTGAGAVLTPASMATAIASMSALAGSIKSTKLQSGIPIGKPEKVKPESKFKVGDTVKVLNLEKSGGRKEYIGKRGNVSELEEDGDYIIAFADGTNYSLEESEIELYVPPVPKPLDVSKLDALVIEDSVKKEIVAVLKQHDKKKILFEEWGLGETIEYGKGMTFLFHGLPGTGKTWGAHCIARAVGKELMVISSANIQTSEPGGAQRNIQNAFSTATEEDKVLFLDECDSLIFNRESLGFILGSEVNTLLTEIEKFEGTLILATNRVNNMDAALERRISLIVEFPEPTKEQRLSIWKKLIPSKMPLHKKVSLKKLSEVNMTGGFIKNAVLQAARLALADDAKQVTQAHFDQAIKRVKKSENLMGKGGIQHGATADIGADTKSFLETYKSNIEKDGFSKRE